MDDFDFAASQESNPKRLLRRSSSSFCSPSPRPATPIEQDNQDEDSQSSVNSQSSLGFQSLSVDNSPTSETSPASTSSTPYGSSVPLSRGISVLAKSNAPAPVLPSAHLVQRQHTVRSKTKRGRRRVQKAPNARESESAAAMCASGSELRAIGQLDFLIEGLSSDNSVAVRGQSFLSLANEASVTTTMMMMRVEGMVPRCITPMIDCANDSDLASAAACLFNVLARDSANHELFTSSCYASIRPLMAGRLVDVSLDSLVPTPGFGDVSCDAIRHASGAFAVDIVAAECIPTPPVRDAVAAVLGHKDGDLDIICSGPILMYDALCGLCYAYADARDMIREEGILASSCEQVKYGATMVRELEEACSDHRREKIKSNLPVRWQWQGIRMVAALSLLESAIIKQSRNKAALISFQFDIAVTMISVISRTSSILSSTTPRSPPAILCLELLTASLRLLVNLTNHFPESSKSISSASGANGCQTVISSIVNLTVLPLECLGDHAFDLVLPALVLLVNLLEDNDEFREGFSSASVLIEGKTISCIEAIIQFFESKPLIRSSSERTKEEAQADTEANIIASYAALLIGCIVRNHSKNRSKTLMLLPTHSFDSLASLLVEFIAYQEQVEVLTDESRHGCAKIAEELADASPNSEEEIEIANLARQAGLKLQTLARFSVTGDEKEPKEEKVVEKENKSPKAKTERRNRRKETPRSLKDTEGGEVVLKRAAKN